MDTKCRATCSARFFQARAKTTVAADGRYALQDTSPYRSVLYTENTAGYQRTTYTPRRPLVGRRVYGRSASIGRSACA